MAENGRLKEWLMELHLEKPFFKNFLNLKALCVVKSSNDELLIYVMC